MREGMGKSVSEIQGEKKNQTYLGFRPFRSGSSSRARGEGEKRKGDGMCCREAGIEKVLSSGS